MYWFIASFARGGIYSKLMVGRGLSLVRFVHARDAARGFSPALEKSDASIGKTYTLPEDRARTCAEVYGILSELVGGSPPKYSIPPGLARVLLAFTKTYDRLGGGENLSYRRAIVDAVTEHRACRIDKAKQGLGYTPSATLRRDRVKPSTGIDLSARLRRPARATI